MNTKEPAGPEVDVEFFNELSAVFKKYPDATSKYSVSRSLRKKEVQIPRESHHMCCEWIESGGRWVCVFQCLE